MNSFRLLIAVLLLQGPGQRWGSSCSSALLRLLQPGRSSVSAHSASCSPRCLSKCLLKPSAPCPGISLGKLQGPADPCQEHLPSLCQPCCRATLTEPGTHRWIIPQPGIFLASDQAEGFSAAQGVEKEKTSLKFRCCWQRSAVSCPQVKFSFSKVQLFFQWHVKGFQPSRKIFCPLTLKHVGK